MTTGSQPWRFLPLSVHDGPTNMAMDEAILDARIAGLVPPTVRLYQWSPSTVTIGRHQSVAAEVDPHEINRRRFQLVRRISGGGAVLHAEDMEVTYAVIARKDEIPSPVEGTSGGSDAIYATILRCIQRTIQMLSVRAVPGVIHCPAVLVDGKKFSGNAQCIKRGVFLQHGTILLSVNPDVMYSVLKPPTGVTTSRMVRSVRAKVTGIEACVGRPIEPSMLSSCFKENFESTVCEKLVDGELLPWEASRVETLLDKYASDAWTMRYP